MPVRVLVVLHAYLYGDFPEAVFGFVVAQVISDDKNIGRQEFWARNAIISPRIWVISWQ